MACKRSGVQIPSAPLPQKPQVNRPAVLRSLAVARVALCTVRPLPAADGQQAGTSEPDRRELTGPSRQEGKGAGGVTSVAPRCAVAEPWRTWALHLYPPLLLSLPG